MTPGWHLLAYDVAQPRRGRRVQRTVRQYGLQLLESLYLCQGTTAELQHQLAALRKLAGPSGKDVVAYRLHASHPIHVCGTARQPAGLLCFGLPDMRIHTHAAHH